MHGEVPLSPGSGAVADALARLLARGSARIRHAPGAVEPVPVPEELLGHGEASFALRRTRLVVEGATVARALGGAARPGLTAELRGLAVETWYLGGMRCERADDVWRCQGRGRQHGPRRPDDPMWPVEALAAGDAWHELGEEVVGGRACRRFAGAFGTGPRARSQTAVQTWIDEDGLLARVSWRGPAARGIWRVTELDDFGVDVHHLDSPPSVPGRGVVVLQLLRRWRAARS